MLGWVVRGLGMFSKDSRSAFFAVASTFVAGAVLFSSSAGAAAEDDLSVCGGSKVIPAPQIQTIQARQPSVIQEVAQREK